MKGLALAFLLLALAPGIRAQTLKAFLPEEGKSNGAAVIICPGGSYYWLSRKVEGSDVAQKLQAEGFAAFVLDYRHAGTRYFLFRDLAFPKNHYPGALEDLRDALGEVRSRADEYSIDPSKVGAMGFSAGGHLVLDAGKELRAAEKPSFIVSVYPVVTMSDEEIVHKRSRTALLGSRRDDLGLRRRLSMELDVPGDMPPVFLVNCIDDKTVDYRNSVVMGKALAEAGIPHEYHQFETGGHGFGASSPTASWLPLFLDWFGQGPVLAGGRQQVAGDGS